MLRKFPGRGSQKIRKLLNFPKVKHSTENSGNSRLSQYQIEQKFPGKSFRSFGYTCPLFRKLCEFAIFCLTLVLLAAITASWTIYAKMTVMRMDYFRILPLVPAARLDSLREASNSNKNVPPWCTCLFCTNIFPIGGKRVTCRGSKLTNSLGKQQLSTRTWSVRANSLKPRQIYESVGSKQTVSSQFFLVSSRKV